MKILKKNTINKQPYNHEDIDPHNSNYTSNTVSL